MWLVIWISGYAVMTMGAMGEQDCPILKAVVEEDIILNMNEAKAATGDTFVLDDGRVLYLDDWVVTCEEEEPQIGDER